jgi:hypothetical protein
MKLTYFCTFSGVGDGAAAGDGVGLAAGDGAGAGAAEVAGLGAGDGAGAGAGAGWLQAVIMGRATNNSNSIITPATLMTLLFTSNLL